MQPIKKLQKARIAGHFKIVTSDGQIGECTNIIPNVGIGHLGDILAGIQTTYIDLLYMETGTGVATPSLTDTDIEIPTTGTNSGRRSITSRLRSVTTPYEVTLSYFIASGDLDRPGGALAVTELAVYWNGATVETGDIFAHGKLNTPVTFDATSTATVSYGIVFL